MAPQIKKSAKVARKFTVDTSVPTDNQVFDPAAYVKYLTENIKIDGHTGNLGNDISVTLDGTTVTVVATAKFSGKYLKYLSKRFLKKNNIKEWIRFVSAKRNTYQLQFYNVEEDEEAEDDE